MSDANRPLFLRIALIVIGLIFIFGIYTLGGLWPSGWAWGQGHSHVELIINLQTAKLLGLEIPPMLLARADEVIE